MPFSLNVGILAGVASRVSLARAGLDRRPRHRERLGQRRRWRVRRSLEHDHDLALQLAIGELGDQVRERPTQDLPVQLRHRVRDRLRLAPPLVRVE